MKKKTPGSVTLEKLNRHMERSSMHVSSVKHQSKPPTKAQSDSYRQLSFKKFNQISSRRSLEVPFKEMPKAVLVDRIKTESDRQTILSALSRHLIFSSVASELLEPLIETMKFYRIAAKEFVFRQDQPADNFFILASGRMEVVVNGKQVDVLKSGQGFGELSLIHDCVRPASVRAMEGCTFWAVDRSTFRTALTLLHGEEHSENRTFIDSVRLFSELTEEQKEGLLGVVVSSKYVVGQRIVTEGEQGDVFYIIKEGVVSCSRSGIEIRRLTVGDFFGEQALLYGGRRTATVTAVGGDVRCLSIGRNNLVQVFGAQLQEVIYRNTERIAFERSETLRKLRSEHISRVIEALTVRSYPSGHIIIPHGWKKGVRLWIVLKGALKTLQNHTVFTTLACIGDVELETEPHGFYDDTYFAFGEEVSVAEIDRDRFESCIEGRLTEALRWDEAYGVLRRVQLLRGLSPSSLSSIARVLQSTEFEDGQEIVKQRNTGDTFFIIMSGMVVVYQDGLEVRTISKLDYFGERAVLFNDFRSATVVAKGEVKCLTLKKTDFFDLIDESVRQRLLQRIQLQDLTIDVDKLVMVKRIGRGRFSNVFLCVNITSGALYALKSVTRKNVHLYDIHENMQLQRKILLELDHVFIVKLVRTFKDERRLYLLMEFIKGIDFYDLLRKVGLFSNSDAMFYTGQLLGILECLHERGIIYRDLKPENLLVDEEGYLRLIDFSTAKYLHGRNYTVVGTPHYMAPEIITGKGYGFSADLYSIGVILYEMVCGEVPFGDEEEDPYVIYQKIIEHRLEFSDFVSPTLAARPIIEQLLHQNPSVRAGGSIDNVKAHSWFAHFDWVFAIQDSLISKQTPAPFIPDKFDHTREIAEAINKKRFLDAIDEITREREEVGETIALQHRIKNQGWDAEF